MAWAAAGRAGRHAGARPQSVAPIASCSPHCVPRRSRCAGGALRYKTGSPPPPSPTRPADKDGLLHLPALVALPVRLPVRLPQPAMAVPRASSGLLRSRVRVRPGPAAAGGPGQLPPSHRVQARGLNGEFGAANDEPPPPPPPPKGRPGAPDALRRNWHALLGAARAPLLARC